MSALRPDPRRAGNAKKRWNKLLCALLGHDPKPITDFMTGDEMRAEVKRTGGNIRIWARCARCGFER